MKAVWNKDYDMHTDREYERPSCPECQEAIIPKDGRYVCINCGAEAELDDAMKQWMKKRYETKTEIELCLMCKQKTMQTRYIRNPVTFDWQAEYGHCRKCGATFMV